MVRTPCCDKNGLKKGPWTPEEDQKLIDYIQKHGYGNWRTLPKNAGLQRCGKSCRLRWTNYLRPDIKRGKFSWEEEETIIQMHSVLGNKWSAIAARLPGRTDNEIKNYWNTHIRKRLLRMGIDPVTHSPRLDLLDLSSMLNSSSLYNHQMNFSSFLGCQTLPNSELLKLAAFISSSQKQNINPYSFHQQETSSTQFQDIPYCSTLSSSTPCVPFSGDDQLHYSSNNASFNNQSCQIPGNLMTPDFTECYVNGQDQYVYNNNQGSDHHHHQLIMEHLSSEASTFQSNGSNNNLSFQSGMSNLSTPSSSPAPLNSSSTTYVASSCTEDERESNCSNMLKFEIPDILGVSEFM